MKSNTKKRKYKPEQVIKTATGENQHERFANQYHPYQHESSLKFDEITDAVGLRRAYDQGDYYVHGKTMFIAGSHTKRDWYDDFTKIPFWGDLRESNRYQKAKEQLESQGQIDTVVGQNVELEACGDALHKQVRNSEAPAIRQPSNSRVVWKIRP